MIDHRVECEECENTSYVATFEEPMYCPICGRRARMELVKEDDDYWQDDE